MVSLFCIVLKDLESISGDEEPPKPPQRDRTSKEDLQRARELYAELQQVRSIS